MAAGMVAESSNSYSNSASMQGPGSQKRKREESEEKPSLSMTRMIVAQNNAASTVQQELEQQLFPTADECSKLASVIRMLDKHGVGSEKLPAETGVSTLFDALNSKTPGWPHAIPLLEFYLDLASSAIQARLSNASASGTNGANMAVESSTQAASASSSNSTVTSTSASTIESDIDQFTNTIRSVLEQLKDTAAARLARKRVKQSGNAKYALHRSINGSYDLFSSLTDTIPNDDKSWQNLNDTDLLAVYPTELAASPVVPRLGDLNGPQPSTSKRAIELQPTIEPVTFLYYDPYQSFAPTYDSSMATLSYAQSVSLRESRMSVKEWEKRPLPPLPPAELAGPIRPSLTDSLASIDPELFSSNEAEKVQPEELKLYLRMMEDSQIIDKRLAENTELLRALQEAQWHRLRKRQATASDLEIKSAERLLESLTSLANARPRNPELSRYSSSPFVHTTSAITGSIVQTKSKAYYGILDKANSKAIPDYVMSKEHEYDMNALKKEGSTLASTTEMSRKTSTQGQKKSKKNSSSSKKDKNQAQNGSGSSPTVQSSELPAGVNTAASSGQVKQETPAA